MAKHEASDTEQVQANVDEETEQGFRGTKVDPRPDSDYTLQSGPDSPSAFEDDTTRAAQHSKRKS